ncbi:MAG: HipA domain-containing protein [Clostridia bacterium]|nr:HipA domain-containing protein [Clostridia bacterium]
MEKILDFTNSKQIINKYGGADTKKTIIYNNKFYLLKFPGVANQNKEISYSNNVFSEYLGCHIFNIIGIKAQNTILGTYQQENGTKKIVCACEDFTGNGFRLVEFQNLKNSFFETSSSSNGRDTSLKEILEVIENHTDLANKNQILKRHFWDMFIVDALIGNYDRHNGNWGILVNDNTEEIELAPIYDCGSCLCSQLTDEQMEKILKNPVEINNRIYNKPTSTITENDKRINYYEYIASLKNEDCNKAILRIEPCIDINKIEEEINKMPIISDIRKQFYKTLIKGRHDVIIKRTYNKLLLNKP